MSLNKALGRVATTLVAGAMLTALAMPAYAAEFSVEQDSVGTIDSDSPIDSVTFVKTLTIPANVPVPTVTFDFTMQGVSGGSETAKDTSNHEIAVSDGTNTIPENKDEDDARVITSTAVFSETATPDSVNNDIVSAKVKFSLEGMSFTEPGVYKYSVTEATKTGYTTASAHSLYLYVENVKDYETPQVTGAVLKDDQGNKTATVANTYDSNGTLKVTKKLDGDMANASEAFAFTVTVKGDQNRPITAINSDPGNPVTISKWSANTGWTVTTKLGDGDSLTIYGLSEGDGYTIDETDAYTDNYVTTIDTDNDAEDEITEKAAVEAGLSGNYRANDGNIDVVYTNARESVTPTGIVMNVAPYVLLVVVAAAGCFVFLRKRRED